MSNDEQDGVPAGRWARRAALARLGLRAGWRATGHLATRWLGDEHRAEERRGALALAQARDVARELGALKGSMMKIGQMLSTYGEGVLPAEANAALKGLQSSSPPLSWEAIRGALERELGAAVDDLAIEPVALASASLGQVHRAVVRATGAQVAVKVQYPGVAAAVDADLATLRAVLGVAGLAPTGPDGKALFAEVHAMLRREVDYEVERQTTERFAEALSGDPGLIVPATWPRFSTSRVLTTTYFEGVRFDDPAVLSLPQVRRDALAASLFELFLREVFELRLVQTDPHLGNYLVQVDSAGDRVVLLDFGATRALGDDVMSTYARFIDAAARRDAVALEEVGREMGFLRDGDGAERVARFHELCGLVVEPLGGGIYDWGASDLTARMGRRGADGALRMQLRTPPGWTFFLDRKLGGIYVLLAVLGARFDGRALLDPYLDRWRDQARSTHSGEPRGK